MVTNTTQSFSQPLPPAKGVAEGSIALKPFKSQVWDAFFTDSPVRLAQDIVVKTLIPGIKTLFVQGIAAFILSGLPDKARFVGGTVMGAFGYSYPYSYVSPMYGYSGYSSAYPYGGMYQYNTMQTASNPTALNTPQPMGRWTGAVNFPTEEAARSCLHELLEYIRQYQRCSLVTIYEMAQLPDRNAVSAKWGYTDLSGCTISQNLTTGLWELRFPAAVPIN